MSGDLCDLAFAEKAMSGASVVYDCSAPPYAEWHTRLLPLGRGALYGAMRAGAKLVAMDNLYMYGKPSGPISPETPVRPCSKKGVVRAQLADERLAAHARGDVRVAIARASDFFGPRTTQAMLFAERFFQRVLAGKSAECFGDPEQLHAYSYTPDIADALVTLGEREEALGRVWHVPTHSTETTRAMIERMGRALGVAMRISPVPGWIPRVAGLFSPMMREVAEMTYQYEVPYVVDDHAFRKTFGVAPTPLDEAIAKTAEWVLATYVVRRPDALREASDTMRS